MKAWIDEGLKWEEGFTFKVGTYVAPLKPRRPTLPPAREGRDHPIDRIVDAYHLRTKIAPPEPLDDIAFIRRVYLDTIGLLPAREELDAFLNDTAPDKRATLIRRVLDDNRAYADHWLTFWNDLLRNDYQGTGYIDGGRKQISGWIYDSLVQNKPYDQFTRELINPSSASDGFINGIKWRGRVNASQVREVQFAQNVAQVFFGANLKCASCHDSFIDKWKLEDAYGLAAVIADQPPEIHRCDKPTGKKASPRFIFPELGDIDPKQPKAKRLEQLAALVTHPENGRFTRTIVNRIWQRLMGRGIVHPVDVMANRPWSEDLLDYLAVYLVDQKYDMKKLIEHILTSRAYQSRHAVLTKEPQGDEYVFRGPEVKRMTAEQFMDARVDDHARRSGQARRDGPLRIARFSAVNAAGTPIRARRVDECRLVDAFARPAQPGAGGDDAREPADDTASARPRQRPHPRRDVDARCGEHPQGASKSFRRDARRDGVFAGAVSQTDGRGDGDSSRDRRQNGDAGNTRRSAVGGVYASGVSVGAVSDQASAIASDGVRWLIGIVEGRYAGGL